MTRPVELCVAYRPSDDVVAREIEGEIVIVPLVAGIGDLDGGLFTLNETGKAVWDRLDGERPLAEVAADLAVEYDGDRVQIETDVLALVGELLERRMVVVAG